MTTELLGLRATSVGDQEVTVVGNEELAELKSRSSVVVLGVVSDKRLGDSLADSVDLRSGTTTRDTEADVDGRELVLTDNEDGLEDLPSEDLGLNEGDGLAVEADETLALLAVGDGGSRLLLAEARYGRSRHDD